MEQEIEIEVLVAGPEHEQYVDTSSRSVREAYKNYWVNRQHDLTDTFAKSGVDTVSIATDDDYARYIQACYDRSNIKTDVVVTPETDEQILTLSTCDSLLSATEGRLLVHAKMTERSRTPVQMPSQPAQGSSQESSQQ